MNKTGEKEEEEEEEEEEEGFTFHDLSDGEKEELLIALGYGVNQDGYITKNGSPIQGRYSDDPVPLKNASIVPDKKSDDAAVIFNTSAVSLSRYIREHLEGDG